jgi:uncharacterized protein YjbI with pentapeptide repeats
MQVDDESFRNRLKKPVSWDEHTFRFCTFSSVEAAGAHITSNFIDSTLEDCDFYWALFNMATLVGVKFKNCRFRGAIFSGSLFVECTFENCEFTVDAFGGDCTFEDSRWYACKQWNTRGLSEARAEIVDSMADSPA